MLALLAGCATAVPETPTPEPTSCEKGQGNCLEISFDGEICTYESPTDIKAGPVTLLFLNEGEQDAAVGLLQHYGDKTVQDAISYIDHKIGN